MGSCFTLFNEAAAATTPAYVRSILRYVECSAIGSRGEGITVRLKGPQEAEKLAGSEAAAGGLAGEWGLFGLLGSTCREAAAESGDGEASGPHRPPVHYKPNESFHGDAQDASGQGLRTGLVCSGGTWGTYAWSNDKGHGSQRGDGIGPVCPWLRPWTNALGNPRQHRFVAQEQRVPQSISLHTAPDGSHPQS